MNRTFDTLDFTTIKTKLKEFAHSETVERDMDSLIPFLDQDELTRKIAETTAARQILDTLGQPPLPYSGQILNVLDLCDKGDLPTPEQLMSVYVFANSCEKMVRYLSKAESLNVRIASFGKSLNDLFTVKEEIDRCIRNDQVDSNATAELSKLRRSIEKADEQVKTKANNALRQNSKYLSENYVSKKNGRYVLPIKKQFRNQVNGSVIEVSGSGGTCFIEPTSVTKQHNELEDLKIQEENEVRMILYTLAALVSEYGFEIRANIDMIDQLDLIFAKGQLSQSMNATEPKVTTDRIIMIKNGRHPLIDKEKCVPLNFKMTEETSGVIITGPNTGGKTVALKTVGLLSMMAQSGLHIPADPGSKIAMHSAYLCDIGDNQSISENLSTFSAHMTNIIAILKEANNQSLIIIDELGSGTDPAEGMGIAIAILEELRRIGCMFLVSTHYPQVKDYSMNTTGIDSARMAFDKDTLTPLYRLEMGETGESCALHIVKELGLPQHILDEAYEAAYSQKPINDTKGFFGKDLTESPRQKNRGKRIIKSNKPKGETIKSAEFKQGDSVRISPENILGIVYEPMDKKGEICVQVKGEKIKVNHKRIKMNIPAESLYPEDYDMSIVFDSVENRKGKNKLDKGNPNGVIEYDE